MYRYWTHELEETVQKVETYMEEACDQYFKDVKPRAVKVRSSLIMSALIVVDFQCSISIGNIV